MVQHVFVGLHLVLRSTAVRRLQDDAVVYQDLLLVLVEVLVLPGVALPGILLHHR